MPGETHGTQDHFSGLHPQWGGCRSPGARDLVHGALPGRVCTWHPMHEQACTQAREAPACACSRKRVAPERAQAGRKENIKSNHEKGQ